MSVPNAKSWVPWSWRQKPNLYHITYNNEHEADRILNKLSTLPPLVSFEEICTLKSLLKQVYERKRFTIQCGDCAELLEYCNEASIAERLGLLTRLGHVFASITGTPTVLLGRMAGQYGKPRNTLTELIDGKEIPKFYGDNINGHLQSEREPDPNRLAEAYAASGLTINYLRTILAHDISSSNVTTQNGHSTEHGSRTEQSVASFNALETPAVYTSHEALFLHYEQALTKLRRPNSAYYNASAHFIWIGDKTRHLHGAHVDYVRGLSNPIGIKLGPSTKPDELPDLLKAINPDSEHGKVTLITRLGADKVSDKLTALIVAVQKTKQPVIWQCDPMHGNTWTTGLGVRTRSFSDILAELVTTIKIHTALGSQLGGIHLETSSDDIVECVGGPGEPTVNDLGSAYKTKCDPRLNGAQAESLIEQAAEQIRAAGIRTRTGSRL